MIAREELWKNPGNPGMIIVTTNGYIRYDGALVMGRGAALEATRRIPDIDFIAGTSVYIHGMWTGKNTYEYGFLPIKYPNTKIPTVGFGIFQVKYHWSEPANLELIAKSAKKLKEFAQTNHTWKIRMNFPGVGNGRLAHKWDEILEILAILPDNVKVCYR